MTDCKGCWIPLPRALRAGTDVIVDFPPDPADPGHVPTSPPRGTPDTAVDFQQQWGGLGTSGVCLLHYTLLVTSEVYEAEEHTSTLYPIEFDDSLAPSAAAPSASWGSPPMDAMTVSMVAPAVYRRGPPIYDKAEPEALGVAMLAPSVYRRSTDREYTYTEALGVAMLPPAVSRRNHPVYTIPEESLAIAMLAPTVTRTNT